MKDIKIEIRIEIIIIIISLVAMIIVFNIPVNKFTPSINIYIFKSKILLEIYSFYSMV